MADSAIVVGAGIGGLTAALALARKGFDVTVLEQAARFGEVGAGIQVSPNASRVLFELGLEKPIGQLAFVPEAVEMRSWRLGQRLVLIPLGDAVEARHGAPFFHLHRADLHAVLADAAAASGRIELRLGARCESIEQDGTSAAATTEEGDRYEAALLVGADGIQSRVRPALVGDAPPRFTGCVAWRGLVPAEAVRDADLRPVAGNWMGPGKHFVHYYVRAGRLVNFVAVVEKRGWTVESWSQRGEKRELVADFAGWHRTVRSLIAAADPERCFKWALFDRDPLVRWSRGRITLLGDACHPMLPFMAQGACMAIEDAAVLGECLAEAADVPSALQRYESLRRDRTARMQLGSRSNAELYHLRGPRAWLRNLVLPLRARALLARTDALYDYDAFAAGDSLEA